MIFFLYAFYAFIHHTSLCIVLMHHHFMFIMHHSLSSSSFIYSYTSIKLTWSHIDLYRVSNNHITLMISYIIHNNIIFIIIKLSTENNTIWSLVEGLIVGVSVASWPASSTVSLWSYKYKIIFLVTSPWTSPKTHGGELPRTRKHYSSSSS